MVKYPAVQVCVCCLRVRVLDSFTYLWQPFKDKKHYQPEEIRQADTTTCTDCEKRYGQQTVRKAAVI